MNRRTLKEGFVKVLNGEKNIFTVGNIKLGKKTRWSTQYIMLLQDTIDKKNEIHIYDSQNDAYKNLPKSVFHLDKESDATQMVATLGEQFCVIVSCSTETLTFSCNCYGELLDWINNINRHVKGIARVGSKQGDLPPIPKDGDVKKEFKRGTSEPGKRIQESGLETQIRSLSAARASICDMENNSIYGSSNIFAVDIAPNETANKLKLQGRYNLLVHDDGIQLLLINSSQPLYYWPVRVLRRFGASNSRFSFESGRSSQTGAGQFEFFSPSCKLINEAVAQLTERVKTGMNTNDIYQRDSKSPLPLEQSPLTNSHHATKVQSSLAMEKFSEKLHINPGEFIQRNPLASVDSLNGKFYSSEEFNLSKNSLPFEIESNYDNYSYKVEDKKVETRIRSKINEQEPNIIQFNTSKKPTAEVPTYINIDHLLKTTDNQPFSPTDGITPMNAPLVLERMRSESEPTPPGKIAQSEENAYVNMQNFSLIPDYTPPVVHVSKAADSFENVPTSSPGLQRSVYSHSTQNISKMFEASVETNKQTSTLPKSFSSLQISQQQQQQFFPQHHQQFYQPSQDSQQYMPHVQRFYQPTPQQVHPNQHPSYPSHQHSFPYLQPQVQQPQAFHMGRHVYPRSAPSSGVIDPAQRPTARKGYPTSAPNSGYHLTHRDQYNAQ